jgi:hypothetical protein
MRLGMKQIALLLVASAIAGGIAGRVTRLAKQAEPSAPPETIEATAGGRRMIPLLLAESVYDGKLGPGWRDLGWGRHNLQAGSPARVVFEGYGGIIFHHQELPPDYGGVAFRFKAPASWSPFLAVSLKHAQRSDGSFPAVTLKASDLAKVGNGWQEAFIEWSRLNPQDLPFDRIVLSASRQVGGDWIEIDKVMLTRRTGKPASAPVRAVNLAIFCDQPAVRISPMIYGISMGAFENGGTANRIGGNVTTRLNWDLGAVWNAGNDWFFENASGTGTVWTWIDEAAARGVLSAVTVPMIGWVAKDKTSVGFPLAKFGKQREHDPHRPEAGNGIAPDGREIRPGPPSETSVPAPPEKVAAWISKVREIDGARKNRSVLMYILDNEPSLWHRTHRDVHPDPVTQDELLERTLRYGQAIRSADPDVPIAGPAEWGWPGYFFSAKDQVLGQAARPDRRAHGDLPLIPWYLRKLADHEKSKKARLLDVLDLHFYPQAERIFGTNPRTDREGAALRIRSTRAFWDPKYTDESWINQPVRLIPRMKEWIAENYPGLKTSIGEWSFGADDHISGALATAETLGRFGQQGLDSAFYWGGPMPQTAAFWAFRAFRNFDGAGGRFLDWSLSTREGEDVSFFASRDEAGGRVVAIVLNLNPTYAARVSIDKKTCGTLTRQRAFTYAENFKGISSEPREERSDELAELVPPYGIRILDLSFVKPP